MKQESSDESSSDGLGGPEAGSRAELEAIEWVVRMTSGEATEADGAALTEWRARSPEHEAALAMASRLWLGLGPAFSMRAKTRTRQRRSFLALAASVLVAVLGYQAFHIWRADDAGGRNSVAILELDDSAGHSRLVLGHGEAYFDVTPSSDLPTAGDADETQVRVLDAAFSVKPYAAGVLVTVTGGRVEVNDGKAARVVAIGQQMRCRAVPHPAATQADLEAEPDWRRVRSNTAVALKTGFRRAADPTHAKGF